MPRLSAAFAAESWLPGFGPGEDPLEALASLPIQVATADIIPFVSVTAAIAASGDLAQFEPIEVVVPATEGPLEAPWPVLTASTLGSVGGEVARFNRNITAIKLVKELFGQNRQPTEDERGILQKYVGWGGLPKAFKRSWEGEWQGRFDELKGLLTELEYRSAEDSTLSAHFTEPFVIEAVWQAIRQLGFSGGRIIEPSAGVGHFLGLMPEDIAARSQITAVELDEVTGAILKKLYGHAADVRIQDFAKVDLPENTFDLAVSNVPFGNFGVADMTGRPYSKWSIHNYFFARALDLVRPGGLVVFITSTFTMDSSDQDVRKYLASKGKLLGAFRLPRGTFSDIANTDVTTDLIILQKWRGAEARNAPAWIETSVPNAEMVAVAKQHAIEQFEVNQYFMEEPQNLLGKLSMASMGYGETQVLVPEGTDAGASLKDRVSALPQGIYKPTGKASERKTVNLFRIHADGFVKPGCFVEVNGRIFRSEGMTLVDVHDLMNDKARKRVAGMIGVRDTARKLLSLQAQTEDDAAIKPLQVLLNGLYDAFVARFGYLSTRANALAMRTDPDWPLLLSLELYDDETETARKADVFSKRTIKPSKAVTSVDTEEDGIVVSLNERGCFDAAFVGTLMGKTADEVVNVLAGRGRVFLDPVSREWLLSEEYLSGNVRTKLKIAQQAGDDFALNVKALEEVQPEDLKPSQIEANLGAAWIPVEVVQQFANEILNSSDKVSFDSATSTWSITQPRWNIPIAATQTWGTPRMNGFTIIEHALNQQVPTIKDLVSRDPDKYVTNAPETAVARERLMAMQEKFRAWIFEEDDRRERLVRLYNDTFNSIVDRKYDGSFLTLPGFSQCVTLRKHQLDGIWRNVSSGNTLLAHVVGAGKTLTAVCASMECKRLGVYAKPMHVVPNHMLEQYTAEVVRAYPFANVLMISRDDLEKARRKAFCARIAMGDWDAVIITHSSFERIAMSPQFAKRFVEDEIAKISAAIAGSKNERSTRIVKQLAATRKRWAVRLERLQAVARKDDLVSFEELGVDALYGDEAHLWKNLFRFSKMTRVAGLPDANSERSFDMYLKTRYLMELHGNQQRGVTFMTGTPVANSVAELHVMQRYLQPTDLKNWGLDNFDTWAATFGRMVTSMEVAPDGSGFRLNTRFASFVNLPELLGMFGAIADIRTKEMVDLPTPDLVGGKVQTDAAPASDPLRDFVAELVVRSNKIRSGQVSPQQDNMLAVTNDGRKAALDMRLIDPTLLDFAESKVNKCVARVFEIWQRTAGRKGTQMVFCDLSTPTHDGKFSVYNDMRVKWICMGIPSHEIEFIHDHDSDAAKAKLFRKVREGKVRVLMGSTTKMGMGTNVQNLLYALHHLDSPWRPCDVEQRDGRIERQGNSWEAIEIWRYVTEASFDAYMWNLLETKIKFISQIMRGDRGLRAVEDVAMAALTYAEVKALASGNPLILKKATIDSEVSRLSLLETQHRDNQYRLKSRRATLPMNIKEDRKRVAGYTTDAAKVAKAGNGIVIMKQAFSDVAAAGEALSALVARMIAGRQPGNARQWKIGSYKGMDLLLCDQFYSETPELALQGEYRYQGDNAYRSGDKLVAELGRLVGKPAMWSRTVSEAIPRQEKELDEISSLIGQPFVHADRLEELYKEQAAINSALDLDKSAAGAAALEAEEAPA